MQVSRIVSLCLIALTAMLVAASGAVALAAEPTFRQEVLFKSGVGYEAYRLPSVTTAANGDILVFAQAHREAHWDQTPTDIVMRRSTDGGKTWSPMSVVVNGAGSTVGATSPVVDRNTGALIMPYTKGIGETYVLKSFDNGVTWTNTEITSQVKHPDWGWNMNSPGHGIQLASGRLLFSGIHRHDEDSTSISYSHTYYSDDGGNTWNIGGVIDRNWSNESSMVQLNNGKVFMSIRDREGYRYRLQSESPDGGLTWNAANFQTQLLSPNVHGSVVRLTSRDNGDDFNRILFSSPNAIGTRRNMMVRTSYDEAKNWASGNTVYFGLSAYSDLNVSNGLAHMVYERGRTEAPGKNQIYREIAFAQFNKEWSDNPPVYHFNYDFGERSQGLAAVGDSQIRDSGPWALHANTVGQPRYVPGRDSVPGGAVRFDGQTKGIKINVNDGYDLMSLTASESFTLETVFRTGAHTDGGDDGRGTIFSNGYGRQVLHPGFSLSVQDGKLGFQITGNTYSPVNIETDFLVSDDLWHHVAAVRDTENREIRLFVDHLLVASFADNLGSITNGLDWWIGQDYYETHKFNGDIDAFRFTTAALNTGDFIPVPEPGTLALGAMALVGLVAIHKRRRRALLASSDLAV